MKRHYSLCLLTAMLLGGLNLTAQETVPSFEPANLKGVWQMCFYVSDSPQIPGELKPGNTFKILSNDGHITNFTLVPGKGAILTGEGTYEQIADDKYVEHIDRSIHLPMLNGKTNTLTFEIKDDRLLKLKFYIEKDQNENTVDTWYHETWVRVLMPDKYPEDLLR